MISTISRNVFRELAASLVWHRIRLLVYRIFSRILSLMGIFLYESLENKLSGRSPQAWGILAVQSPKTSPSLSAPSRLRFNRRQKGQTVGFISKAGGGLLSPDRERFHHDEEVSRKRSARSGISPWLMDSPSVLANGHFDCLGEKGGKAKGKNALRQGLDIPLSRYWRSVAFFLLYLLVCSLSPLQRK